MKDDGNSEVVNAVNEIAGLQQVENRLVVGPEVDDYLFIVFSGGQCNFIDATGNQVHNPGRDEINKKLLENKLIVFDPQIGKISHGRDYDYTKDGPVERKVRERAIASLYELNSLSLGGVTFLELVDEATKKSRDGEILPKRVIFLNRSDGQTGFQFAPILNDGNKETHLKEYQKVAVNARNTFVEMVHKNALPNMHIATTKEEFDDMNKEFEGSISFEITMDRLHGDRMMEALCAAKTKDTHVVVYLEGSQKVNNSVKFLKSKTDMTALQFENYVDDGNKLRDKFVELKVDQYSDGSMETVTDRNRAVEILSEAWNEHIATVEKNRNRLEHRIPPEKVHLAENMVYVGGAGWWRDQAGEQHENDGRDLILEALNDKGIKIYEAQARPSKKDKEYEFKVNHPADSAALRNAQVTVVEVNKKTAGGMSAMEVLMCARSLGKEVILFANAPSNDALVFAPEGIGSSSDKVRRDWYTQATSDAQNMRNFFLSHAGEVNRNVKIYTDVNKMVAEKDENVEPVIISGSKLHIKELYEAFDRATRGEAVTILFEETTFPERDNVGGDDLAMVLAEYQQSATEIKQKLLKTAESLLNVTIVHSEEEVIENAMKQWEHRNVQKFVETPIGDLLVTLEDPISQRNHVDEKLADLNRVLTDSPVIEWITSLGIERNKPIDRKGHHDIIPKTQLPLDIPGRLRITNAIRLGNAVRFAFGVYEFKRTHADGKVENLSRVIFFRPPAAAALPIIEVEGTDGKQQYIMLTRQIRDGVGGPYGNELPAGTDDIKGEHVQGMITREIGEEIPLTSEELATIRMSRIHEALYTSPGGEVEKISGFFCHLTLSKERMEQIAQGSKGHDAGEVVQTHFVELPQPPDDDALSSEVLTLFRGEWDALIEEYFYSEGNDSKTVILLQELRHQELAKHQDRLNKKNDDRTAAIDAELAEKDKEIARLNKEIMRLTGLKMA